MNQVEEIYHAHVRILSQDQQLEVAALIKRVLSQQNQKPPKRSRKKRQRSIMELHGLGAEIWQGVNAQHYVNQLRNEWEHPR
jgi:hypothetical protein